MTGLTQPPSAEMKALADEHRQWLSRSDGRYLSNWERLYAADNEAAMAEASVRRRLESLGVVVEPNEDLDHGTSAPDFRCFAGGHKFYVEVTCIRISTAEKLTGVPKTGRFSGNYRPINLGVYQKCIAKVRQAATVDAPLLVAIGTWHGHAATQLGHKPFRDMLLTGETMIAWDMNTQSGEAGDTYLTTELRAAVFLKPNGDSDIIPAREPISGAMLTAFGSPMSEPAILLNPNAHYPFAPALLPSLEYGSVELDQTTKQLHTVWQKGKII
ncbi:hypothetical protein [Allorhodopirellula heiligendammensis]|uniref:Uncharacterized protein n=1 Tax=Allorhodopirellula heiligendammensis TaxID=2714739 RepID=A0A5C6BE85_9BACT|nr:hypothetical protein [Allorhodopirellula heiligendammensis]TWU09957.1 hypothetical protein Poly21_52860 [Allorhodopirellula heiligendammensis]